MAFLVVRKFYFDKNQESSELGSNVKHEACVGSKPLNITFIAGVDKYRGSSVPVLAVDKVLLVENFGAFGLECEVV